MEAVYFSIVDILKEEAYTLSSDEKAKELFSTIFKSEKKKTFFITKGWFLEKTSRSKL